MCRRSPGSVFILFHFCTGGPGGCPGKMPEKLISVFIPYCPANRSSKKRGWLRAFLIGAAAQGRRFESAGALGWAAPGPRAKNFIYELQAERMPGGGGAGAGKLQPFSA